MIIIFWLVCVVRVVCDWFLRVQGCWKSLTYSAVLWAAIFIIINVTFWFAIVMFIRDRSCLNIFLAFLIVLRFLFAIYVMILFMLGKACMTCLFLILLIICYSTNNVVNILNTQIWNSCLATENSTWKIIHILEFVINAILWQNIDS